MSKGDVTTYFDGTSWRYDVEGEPPLGHRFETAAPAIAGGRYLARCNCSQHVIKAEDGRVAECHEYADPTIDTRAAR